MTSPLNQTIRISMIFSRLLKLQYCCLILLVISANGFAFDETAFIDDITQAKELFAQGEHDSAIKYWEGKRSDYAGQEGHYEYELGILYSRLKAFDKAEKIFQKGLELNSKYPRIYVGLSNVYLWTGRFDKSSSLLDDMINAYPEVWLSYYSKAHQEYQLKNYKAAKELSEVALSKQTNAKSYYMLARSSFELNEPRTVISAIENAINLEPNYLANLSAMKIYAVSLASEGLYDQAIIAIEEVKKQNEQAADDEELDKLLQELKNPEKKNGETQQFN